MLNDAIQALAPLSLAPLTHVATLLSIRGQVEDLLVLYGPWPRGLTTEQGAVLTVVRSLLNTILNRMQDAEQQDIHRRQLQLFADITGTFANVEQREDALRAIAAAVARASGFEWATVLLFDSAWTRPLHQAHGVNQYSSLDRADALWQLPEVTRVWEVYAAHITATNGPLLWADLFDQGENSIRGLFERYDPDLLEVLPSFTRFLVAARIVSSAVFPLRFQGELLGLLILSSHLRHPFWAEEVDVLTALANQTAATISGYRVHEELRAANAQLARMATHDDLTGLPNRMLLHQRLFSALQTADSDHPVGLLFIDVDHLKAVNDSLGHPAGDSLLIEAANRLSDAAGPTDTVARYGGDEFAVLLGSPVSEHSARRAAERLLAAVRQPFVLEKRELRPTVSIGIALGAGPAPSALLREADLALYQAKAAGRNRAVLLDAPLRRRYEERKVLETELHEALQRGEIELRFLPEVDRASGRVSGLEALLRWRHPQRGLLPAAEFVPLAEENGLIISLGGWALAEACRQAAAWPVEHTPERLNVSVNISPRQLAQPDFPQLLAAAIRDSGLNPRLLRLELTHDVLINDRDQVLANVAACKALGVQIALDNLGAPHVSLNLLVEVPVDAVKLSRLFVQRLEHDQAAAAVMHGVDASAQALGLSVVATGIETHAQSTSLEPYTVPHHQGHYYSSPIAPDLIPIVMRQTLPQGE